MIPLDPCMLCRMGTPASDIESMPTVTAPLARIAAADFCGSHFQKVREGVDAFGAVLFVL
jgi:hypothetical protein